MENGSPSPSARCPVCGQHVQLEPLLQESPLGRYCGNINYLEYLANSSTGGWACEDCFATGKALRADPSMQTVNAAAPCFAYYDATIQCTDCGTDFVFTAAEQQFWYEHLKFLIWSRPKQCLQCRRQRREQKRIRAATLAELEEALRSTHTKDPEHLAHIAELYLRSGSRKKGMQFLERARNRAKRLGGYADLVAHLDELSE